MRQPSQDEPHFKSVFLREIFFTTEQIVYPAAIPIIIYAIIVCIIIINFKHRRTNYILLILIGVICHLSTIIPN